MAIEVKWLEPGVLLYQLNPPFSWRELQKSLDDSIAMVEAVPELTVGTVLDVNGIISIPQGALNKGANLLKRRPSNTGPVVLVRAHPIVKGFCGLIRLMYPAIGNLIHFADDIPSAVALLRRLLGTREIRSASKSLNIAEQSENSNAAD